MSSSSWFDAKNWKPAYDPLFSGVNNILFLSGTVLLFSNLYFLLKSVHVAFVYLCKTGVKSMFRTLLKVSL